MINHSTHLLNIKQNTEVKIQQVLLCITRPGVKSDRADRHAADAAPTEDKKINLRSVSVSENSLPLLNILNSVSCLLIVFSPAVVNPCLKTKCFPWHIGFVF